MRHKRRSVLLRPGLTPAGMPISALAQVTHQHTVHAYAGYLRGTAKSGCHSRLFRAGHSPQEAEKSTKATVASMLHKIERGKK